MKFFKFTIVIFSVVSLIGCAAESKVKISKAPVQDTEGKIKFKLPKTVVNILKTENTDGKLNFTISAFTSQVEADDTIYAISPSDSFGVKTNLNFTHTIDSDYLLSTLSFDVEDNRIKTIQNVGGLIVSEIPI